MLNSSLRMQDQCTPTFKQAPPYTTFHKSSIRKTSCALIDDLDIVFFKNIINFSDTYWLQVSGTGVGIAPARPELQCTMPLMRTHFSPPGLQIYFSTADSLITSLAFGFVTPALNITPHYGHLSKTPCKAGIDWNGNFLPWHTYVTSWISPWP